MKSKTKDFFLEPKSKIGLVHGVITVIGSILLGFLTMMIFSKFIPGDYGVKIVPSMILTPILIACYSIWLLFSNTILKALLKSMGLIIILFIIIKVF